MNNEIIIKSSGLDQQSTGTINAYIRGFQGKNEGFVCKLRPIRDLRSLRQNRLLWVLMGAVSRKQGDYKESCLHSVKIAFITAYGLKEYPETSKMDINDMNVFLTFCFDYLMNIAEGYLDVSEGNDWVEYQKSMEEFNGPKKISD